MRPPRGSTVIERKPISHTVRDRHLRERGRALACETGEMMPHELLDKKSVEGIRAIRDGQIAAESLPGEGGPISRRDNGGRQSDG
jgi:hypothetical protein